MSAQGEDTHPQGKVLFVNLIMSLASSAMQQLGKLVDPATRKARVDLRAATATIDLLEMLEEKTRGNLDEEEKRLLGNTLASLRLDFVETSQAQPAQPPAPEPQPAAPEQGARPAQTPDETGKPDKKDPKFHKTYGG